jgi:hypothetical protein
VWHRSYSILGCSVTTLFNLSIDFIKLTEKLKLPTPSYRFSLYTAPFLTTDKSCRGSISAPCGFHISGLFARM